MNTPVLHLFTLNALSVHRLMANNPMLLLQILAYNVECIVKAFSEGMIEIAQNIQENEKISAERMLTCKGILK